MEDGRCMMRPLTDRRRILHIRAMKHVKRMTAITIYRILSIILLTSYMLHPPSVFASLPSSTHYKLQNYGFGAGGTSKSTSTNYQLNGIAGQVEFGAPGSTNYQAGSGILYMQMANLPPAPTFTNPSSYYNKLQLQINTGNNPSDTQFAIAIQNSSDGYSSTKYVQADDTMGTSPVWQTNTAWGASGFTLIGLTPGVTYKARVAARQGNFTQSGFGPTASASTSNPTFSFSVSPGSISGWNLTPNTIGTSTSVTINLATNANTGGSVYVQDNNTGLKSTTQGHTISSVSNDLTAVSEGYGAQGTSVSQTSGGPMEADSPYNVSGTTVGMLSSTNRVMFDSSSQPVTGGVATFSLLAKPSATAPPGSDYSDTLTIVAAADF